MKTWQFAVIVGLLAAVLYIVIQIGTGLQAAQSEVSGIVNPFKNLLAKVGL